MAKLMLVDGSNLLFQMFYGMPARITNKDGKAIQGTLGFVGALLKTVRMVCPTHLAVFFDGECHNPRRDMDADYKANRPDFSQISEEDTPFSQLPDIYAALDHLNIKHCETTVCETDDWIAGYVSRYGDNHDIVIMSQDSDFFQLINDRVSVLRYRGDKSVLCTPDYIQQTLGISPTQYAAYKSLTGDNSDNIRGVDKVGPKTAAALMNEFGTLERLIEHAQSIQKQSIRKSVTEQSERILKNFELIFLRGYDDLPFMLDELAFSDIGFTTTQVLQNIGLR